MYRLEHLILYTINLPILVHSKLHKQCSHLLIFSMLQAFTCNKNNYKTTQIK